MMEDKIKLFTHERFGSVRVVMKDNEPWFVAKDVCDALGTTTKDIPAILDEDEKGIDKIDTLGGVQQMTVVSEPGLYSLILRSRKPEAKEFKRWVTHNVLPSIRKTGSYSIGGIAIPDFTDPASAARAWAEQYEEIARTKEENERNRKALALTSEALALTSKSLNNTSNAKREAIETAEHAYQHQHELDDRRTATAMGRLGGYVKDRNVWKNKAEKAQNLCNCLKDEIGDGQNWKTVKAIPWLKQAFKREAFSKRSGDFYKALGKTLSKISKNLNKPKKQSPDTEFGHVNRYHIDVINYAEENLLAFCDANPSAASITLMELSIPNFWMK